MSPEKQDTETAPRMTSARSEIQHWRSSTFLHAAAIKHLSSVPTDWRPLRMWSKISEGAYVGAHLFRIRGRRETFCNGAETSSTDEHRRAQTGTCTTIAQKESNRKTCQTTPTMLLTSATMDVTRLTCTGDKTTSPSCSVRRTLPTPVFLPVSIRRRGVPQACVIQHVVHKNTRSSHQAYNASRQASDGYREKKAPSRWPAANGD